VSEEKKESQTLPQMVDAVFKHATELSNQDKFDEAINAYSNIVDCVGMVTGAVVQRGRCHWEMRRWSLAKRDFNFAIAIDPMNADVQWTKALLDLQLHDFENGWRGYESRWGSNSFKAAKLHTTRPQWQPGMECDHLFVWQEQGVGDQIIYTTFLPLLKKQVKRLTVMIDHRLVPLYQRSFPDIEFIGPTDRCKLGKNAAHLPMGSISQHFIRKLSDIPKNVSVDYLKPDLEKRDLLRKSMGVGDKDFVVGISWASRAASIGHHKSMSLEAMLPFFNIPGIKFVNLQYTDVSKDINDFKDKHGKKIITVNAINNFLDLDGLASLISACNAVVSVSNATVHLAAAMGKPVFLLDANKLFFWNHRVGRKSLWYSSVRIYPRGNMLEPWTLPVEAAAKDLKAMRDMQSGLLKPETVETFVFFHVGNDISYPQKLVSSIRISNPAAEIIMCTDKATPEVVGIDQRIEDEVDRTRLMTERLRMYGMVKLLYPAIYLDTDMLVTKKISPTEMLEDNDIALCQRSFDRDAEFNVEQRGLSFPEYAGKTLMEVYPYLACTIVAKDHTVWDRLLEILRDMDPKYHVWYGDQEALKVIATERRGKVTMFSESEYGCLPEHIGTADSKIFHFKGPHRKQMFEDVA
jgi:hypothetical protein